MPRTLLTRIQVGLVLVLFLGSLAILLGNSLGPLVMPEREVRARADLREASGRMAEAATPRIKSLADRSAAAPPADLDRELFAVADRVLADYPGVEGGFYLGGDLKRFSGFAFPTGRPRPEHGPRHNEPPPLEAPYIRLQAQDSLTQNAGQALVAVRDVGPSRVLILTEPVGPDRPALGASWTMFRLIGPQQLEGQVRRYRVSVGLALGGLAVSLALTLNLGRTLKRQRREQDRLRDELRRSEHLAALGKMLAGVAHEIRNPLAGIRSTVQLWQRLPEAARSPSSMDAIIRAVDRLNDIVTRLLYFARADGAQRQPVQVNQVLAETLQLLQAQAAEQGVALETDLEPGVPEVAGSAGALRQVFLNLATNALQAMSGGGRLHCSTRRAAPGNQVQIRFADTGPGISAEDRQHLFEPFFTTRPEGTGLGLALCHEIVTQHGGRIELEAGAGPGARFCVTLPAAG